MVTVFAHSYYPQSCNLLVPGESENVPVICNRKRDLISNHLPRTVVILILTNFMLQHFPGVENTQLSFERNLGKTGRDPFFNVTNICHLVAYL
jgi:hypothetical protein